MSIIIILVISAKMATLALPKINVVWNKGYEVIIFPHGVSNQILSRESSYIKDLFMWTNFGNSSISLR